MKKSLALLVTVIAVPVLAGCTPAADATTQTNLTIGVAPVADLAPLFLGVKEGFFADEGINLTINSLAPTSSAVLNAVDKNDFDFGYADTVSILAAHEQGLGVEIISGAAATSGEPKLDYAALVVHEDSLVDSLDDLRYLHVSIDAKATTNDVVVKDALEGAGVELSSVTWHELAFVDTLDALTARRIDAAFVVEPFVTHARMQGFRVVSFPYAEFDPSLTVSGYVASKELADRDPEVVDRFLAALEASYEFANKEKFSARANIGTYVDSGQPVESRLSLPIFTREFDRDAMAKLADAAMRYGFISNTPDLEAMLP
jgi:NitT/TauT family transport system substrate-binding protein